MLMPPFAHLKDVVLQRTIDGRSERSTGVRRSGSRDNNAHGCSSMAPYDAEQQCRPGSLILIVTGCT